DRDALGRIVEPGEIDEQLDRALERRMVADRAVGRHSRQQRPDTGIAGPELAGTAEEEGGECEVVVEPGAEFPAEGRDVRRGLDRLFPEDPQALEPRLRRIADEDGGGDRADRGAEIPVRFDSCAPELFTDAEMIGTKGIAAAEHERGEAIAEGKGPGLLVSHERETALPALRSVGPFACVKAGQGL